MTVEEIIKAHKPISLQKKTLLNLSITNQILTEDFNEVLKPYDLSNEQFNVLRILRGQENQILNMQSIQERMVAKTSNTTRLVDKLLLKDMVTRDVCPSNRRKVEIKLTGKGFDVLRELDPKIELYDAALSSKLNDAELQLLNNLLDKLRKS
ncbi:MarR family winged helix-turn-helix transcriptional regulator [Flavobacterium ardleyense]|uniref:MarR family winged helix-turn-helix transcriptional regulator n=1 Tax=Flavobacterium ardleyense TaxID=2038737 RepID=UPI00298C31E8|nr:MarR family transcriptional regulator [Flavobacterium ardleyense]